MKSVIVADVAFNFAGDMEPTSGIVAEEIIIYIYTAALAILKHLTTLHSQCIAF